MTDLIPLDAAIAAIDSYAHGTTTLGGQKYRSITLELAVEALQDIPAIDPAAIREAALIKELDMALAANRGLVRLNEMTEARAQRFEAALEEIASHDTGATAGIAHTAMIALIGEKK